MTFTTGLILGAAIATAAIAWALGKAEQRGVIVVTR